MDPSIEARVCVLGPLTQDHLLRLSQWPQPGQTLPASGYHVRFSGKGGNEAVAAARQGATVNLISCLGPDAVSTAYRERLEQEGIDTSMVARCAEPCGASFIPVAGAGQRAVLIAPGANGHLSAEDVAKATPAIARAGVILIAFGLPVDAIRQALRIAAAEGTRSILHPSPFDPAFPWAETAADILILNEEEAGQLEDALPAGSDLQVETLVIRADDGSVEVISPEEEFLAERPDAPESIDATGVDDVFAGVLAAALARGEDLRTAVDLANGAAVLTSLETGLQETFPHRG